MQVESDFSPLKPTTDITLNATAFAPDGLPCETWEAGVGLNDDKPVMARVYGKRHWHKAARLVGISDPKPCLSVPLRYELAFGGANEKLASPFNPIGCGYLPIVKQSDARMAHQIEWAHQCIDARNAGKPHLAAGFGVRHRSWQPRLNYVGTYDEAWVANQHPYPPADFKAAYHLAGCPDLRPSRYWVGGERIHFYHLSPKQAHASLVIPHARFMWALSYPESSQSPTPLRLVGRCHLDTLHFDIESGLDGGQLTAIWRAQWPEETEAAELQVVQLRNLGPQGAQHG